MSQLDTGSASPAPRTTRVGVAVGTLVVSAFVMFLNETVLSVGLQRLSIDLSVSTVAVQWLTSGFLLTVGVVIPTTGFLLERFTTRSVFLASMGLFCLGTLIGGLAIGFPMLLLGRVVQAGGTAMMLPLVATTVMRLVPPQKRGSTMGTIAVVVAFAPALGPTIGGTILTWLGWRWMFFAILPLAATALIAGAAALHVQDRPRTVPLDVMSVVLSAMSFGGILYGVSSIAEPTAPLPPWIPIVVGAVALTMFVTRQVSLQRADRALLNLRPFTSRRFVVALVISGLLFMCHIGAGSVLLPLYLQTVLHHSTFATGLLLLPGGLVLGALGIPAGKLFDHFGARPVLIPGTIALTTALLGFAALNAGVLMVTVIGIHIVLMIGVGLMMTPLMTEPLAALPAGLYAHGSAILGAFQQISGAFGSTLFVTVASIGAGGTNTAGPAGMRLAFVVAGAIGGLALAGALFTRGRLATVPAVVGPDHPDQA
ncbi:DHA2 family efflux MFS transporter permease subunit [Pseudonocardia phyllosphaerae]|uniref:DHA2 family efflux MFS transporter permease subunit n=1 Tax=Pseudonocardia phyllosphaerae TaxID=3390502 RepID=UPI003979FB0E